MFVSWKDSISLDYKGYMTPSWDMDDHICGTRKYYRKGLRQNNIIRIFDSSTSSLSIDKYGIDSHYRKSYFDCHAIINPKSILFLSATLSCIGTMMLIYFTIAIYKLEICACDGKL
eukprot:c17896_g1_i2 orf=275-622(+)